MSVNDFLNSAKKTKEKRTGITESEVEDPFVKYAKSKGCKAYKLVFLVGRGWPDRTILIPGGKIIFIEFKRPGKTLTAKQNEYKTIIKNLGFSYYVCDEIGQAENILDLYLL